MNRQLTCNQHRKDFWRGRDGSTVFRWPKTATGNCSLLDPIFWHCHRPFALNVAEQPACFYDASTQMPGGNKLRDRKHDVGVRFRNILPMLWVERQSKYARPQRGSGIDRLGRLVKQVHTCSLLANMSFVHHIITKQLIGEQEVSEKFKIKWKHVSTVYFVSILDETLRFVMTSSLYNWSKPWSVYSNAMHSLSRIQKAQIKLLWNAIKPQKFHRSYLVIQNIEYSKLCCYPFWNYSSGGKIQQYELNGNHTVIFFF